MAFSIETFKSKLVGGGARPTLFEVQITAPTSVALEGVDTDAVTAAFNGDGSNSVASFMIKAAAIPASNVGQIILPYFGRQVKMGGDRTFDDWTVTVINDEDFAVRNALEEWSKLINTHESNLRALPGSGGVGALGTPGYKADAVVKQYSKTGQVLRAYKFIGLYPTNISDIALSWEATDSIEEFTCTFSYDYWEKTTEA